jgi:glucuronate isomerase
LIARSKVEIVCTTDDPVDDLHYHHQLSQTEQRFRVLPTFRPDKALQIDHPNFLTYVTKLEKSVENAITTYDAFLTALRDRVSYFHQHHCRLSDHALDTLVYATDEQLSLEAIFAKALAGESLEEKEVSFFKTNVLVELMQLYHEHGWTMQLHVHAYRNCNQRMFERLGPDTGYDGINDQPLTQNLQKLLNAADAQDHLPQTILYSLNPNDYDALVALMGCFQQEGNNKLQLGSGWWYNDTRAGMRHQLTKFADGSVIFNFVGMLTDSRSFLSYTRHEYFRRVFCEWLAEIVVRGEAPADLRQLKPLVENVCYQNAKNYFKFQEKDNGKNRHRR